MICMSIIIRNYIVLYLCIIDQLYVESVVNAIWQPIGMEVQSNVIAS